MGKNESFAAVMPVAMLILMLYLTPFVTLTAKELRVYAISTVFLILNTDGQGIALSMPVDRTVGIS